MRTGARSRRRGAFPPPTWPLLPLLISAALAGASQGYWHQGIGQSAWDSYAAASLSRAARSLVGEDGATAEVHTDTDAEAEACIRSGLAEVAVS